MRREKTEDEVLTMRESKGESGKLIEIERGEGDKPIKYLGVRIEADGNMEDEVEERIYQAREFRGRILRELAEVTTVDSRYDEVFQHACRRISLQAIHCDSRW